VNELGLYSCPDYFHTIEGGTVSDSEPNLAEITQLEIDQTAKLSIIDTPIYIPHLYFMDKIIIQRQIDFDGDFKHGTHVAGIAIRTISKIELSSFPAIGIIVPVNTADTKPGDAGIFFGGNGKYLTGIGKLAAALKDFLNSDSKVVNLSAGINNLEANVIAFITPLLKSLRDTGCILTVAAGNDGTNLDENSAVDLLTHFVNKEIVYYADGKVRTQIDKEVDISVLENTGEPKQSDSK